MQANVMAWLILLLMALSRYLNWKRNRIVKTSCYQISAAQLAVMQAAAARPGRVLEPLPSKIKGAAWQSVVDALLASGYATKCYFPCHVEYVLTDVGLAASLRCGESR